jgi:hypothetical protein
MSDDQTTAQEALRCRLSILAHMDNEENGRRMSLELMAIPFYTKENVEVAEIIRRQLMATLKDAETFAVTDEVSELLDGAAGIYPDPNMQLSDILTPNGLAVFSRPLGDPVASGEDGALSMRALSWSLRPASDPTMRILAPNASGDLVTAIGYADTRSIPNFPQDLLHLYPRIYPVVSAIWQVGDRSGGKLWDGRNQDAAELGRSPYIKVLMAFWAIMRQRLTEDRAAYVRSGSKDLKRSLGRAERRHPDIKTGVHIIRMQPSKRSEYIGSGSGRAAPGFRFPVRTHWRDQPYGKGKAQRRQILIASYIKGDPDLPLEHKDRVFLPPLPRG